MAKKYIDNGKRDKRSGNGDLLGIALIVVSAFFLLCIIVPIILGAISQAIRGVILGVFGIFAYPMFVALLGLGIALVRDFALDIKLKNRICIGIITFCLFMILQLATSFMYLGDGFSHYISSVFDAKFTGGGVLFGVLVYGMQALVGQVFTYIIMSLIIVVCVLVMVDVLARLKGGVRAKESAPEPEQSKAISAFEKGDRPAKAVKPIPDSGLYVGKIVKNKPIDTYGGNAMGMPVSDERSDTSGSGNYYSPYPVFDSYTRQEQRSQDGRYESGGRGILDNRSASSGFLKYHDDARPQAAKDILFDKTSPLSGYSGFSGYNVHATSSPVVGTSIPQTLAFPPSDSVVETPTPAMSAPETVRQTPSSRPPKFFHPEVVIPDPKDISDKFVDGEIFDGEQISQKMAEEAEKKAESESKEYAKFDFDNKKVQPQTFRPIDRDAENKKTENATRPEIINGDFYAQPKKEESERLSGIPPFAQPAASEQSPIISDVPSHEDSGLSLAMPDVAETESVSKDEELPPIVNGEDVKKDRSLDSLFEYEREIRERKYESEKKPQPVIEEKPKPTFELRTSRDLVTPSEPKTSPIGFGSSQVADAPATAEPETKDTAETQPEEIPPIINGSSFNIIEEAEDLSERSFGTDNDNTGYYEKEDTPESMSVEFAEPKPEPVTIEPPAPPKPKTQITFDDVTKVKPEDLPKPKPKKKHARYVPPPIDLLVCKSTDPTVFSGNAEENAKILEDTLESLKFPAKVTAITSGPAVTRYELEVPPGNSVRRIDAFADDIAYNLASSSSIRIETPIPGKRAVGIEVPNAEIATVALHDLIDCKEFQNATSPVTFAIGKDIAGANIICNLEKMPHLLIAGATGSGKSACLNSIIISILYKSSPDDVRLILIDPKEVEFRVYQDMPHLLIKSIINDTEQAIRAFKWAKVEMDRRYKLLSKYCVRNIQEFNNSSYVKDGIEEKLPRIIVVVDELCELMLSANRKDLEDKIMSMAQKARAAGLHLILATQRPSVDVITGTIKANLPSRIAFAVSSFNDSRTILDQGGAESLLGRGDMLYAPADMPQPKRVQGAYITTEEVTSVVEYVKQHNQIDFDESVEELIMTPETPANDGASGEDGEDDEYDPLIKDVCRRVIETGQASTSMIQRRFSVGYARASRIIDQMEARKFIGPLEGSNKPREVYITAEQFRETFGEDV